MAVFGDGETTADVTEGREGGMLARGRGCDGIQQQGKSSGMVDVEEKVVLVRLATPSSSRVTCVGKMSLHGCYC